MRLIVEHGYNRGQVYALSGPSMTIGRDQDCHLCLQAEGVSRQHCRLSLKDKHWQLEDLSSRNGSLVNGVPVEDIELYLGDLIRLGSVSLRVIPDEVGPDEAGPEAGGIASDGRTTMVKLHEELPQGFAGQASAPAILGSSAALQSALKFLSKAARASASLLILGESGTGKELFAQALHRLSPRRRQAFVALNSASWPEALVESELFGHEQGAFTGAVAKRAGLVESAHKGTLFLDEIGEMPWPVQAKLLRFLESGEFRRIGSSRSLKADVRVVAATHRDLEQQAQEGRFRSDLLHRLRVLELRLPPLRERPQDVEDMARAFLRDLSGGQKRWSEGAIAALRGYAWPGNVRELRNAVEAAVILADHACLDVDDLPARLASGAGSEAPLLTLREAERRAIVKALAHFQGHRSKTAKALGVDRKTLYHKIKDFGLE